MKVPTHTEPFAAQLRRDGLGLPLEEMRQERQPALDLAARNWPAQSDAYGFGRRAVCREGVARHDAKTARPRLWNTKQLMAS